MRKILMCGLNSYVGRRAACHLQAEDFEVTGLVRSLPLFGKTVSEPVSACLYEVDLLRKGIEYDAFHIESLDMGFYFAQVPTLSNPLDFQVELLALRNFVGLCKRSGCNRVIYIARLMDEQFLDPIQGLFEDLRVQYTIVIKSGVIGKESILNRIFEKLAHHKVLFYWKWIAAMKFHPVPLLDLYRWLREMPWRENFISEIIYLGGIEELSFHDLFYDYTACIRDRPRYEIAISKFFTKLILSKFRGINEEDLDQFRRVMRYEKNVDNSAWSTKFPFKFTPIKSYLCSDR